MFPLTQCPTKASIVEVMRIAALNIAKHVETLKIETYMKIKTSVVNHLQQIKVHKRVQYGDVNHHTLSSWRKWMSRNNRSSCNKCVSCNACIPETKKNLLQCAEEKYLLTTFAIIREMFKYRFVWYLILNTPFHSRYVWFIRKMSYNLWAITVQHNLSSICI